MKKLISVAIVCIMLFLVFVTPSLAAETTTVPDVCTMEGENRISSKATDYFTGITMKMNSLNGSKSKISTISSGSVIGMPSVTSVSLHVTVSAGSDPFKLYVEAPSGIFDYMTVNKSGVVNFSSFNGINPYGKWKVYIVTDKVVSTATARMTVNYSY